MTGDEHSQLPRSLPREPVDRVVEPLSRFLHVEAASGVVLILCAGTALVLANSPLADGFLGFWNTPFTIGIGSLEMSHSLKHWINDGLMAIFFFVIGLEVKREAVIGELRDPRRAALPIAAALGGMIAPAAIYLWLQLGEAGQRGWGIPMATDIAFVVGCMALLGSRVPLSLRVVLLSIAIADDIGAILVIAIGYTETIDTTALLLGVLGVGVVVAMARVGVRSIGVYLVVGAGVWLAFHESGVHATIAGVVLGLLTPARSWVSPGLLGETVQSAGSFLQGGGWDSPAARGAAMRQVETAAREAVSPLERIETRLHPWVGFAIMPVFALANAGVTFEISDFGNPIAVASAAGLVIGKPVGIVCVSWLAVRLGLAKLPEDLDWGVMAGAGMLAGIGFTMALFIAGLALDGGALDAAKVGILGGSAVAGAAGMAWLRWRLPAPAA
ncbi:MAG: Na+/H+ antiporter NhaA [Proteobacteria bacterium]|nr:Na+/H+ antiporter NhaA [Pseudomonadota bacterium]